MPAIRKKNPAKPETPPQDDPLEDSFIRFLKVERNASLLTLQNYAHSMRRFRQDCPVFSSWKECQADDFRAWLFLLMKREQSRATIRLHFSALRSFFKFLMRRENLAVNPLLDVQMPKSQRSLPVVLTLKQVEELLELPLTLPKEPQAPEWGPARDAAILETFYSTGLRLHELVGIDVGRGALHPQIDAAQSVRCGSVAHLGEAHHQPPALQTVTGHGEFPIAGGDLGPGREPFVDAVSTRTDGDLAAQPVGAAHRPDDQLLAHPGSTTCLGA